MSDDLEPIAPAEAVEMYIEARQDDCTENTIEGQYYRLQAFLAWCDEEDITNLNELDGRDLYAYRVWRREGGYSDTELAGATLRGDLATLRAFLRFCGEVEAVPPEFFDRVPLPSVSGGADVSASTLDPDRAQAILEYLQQFEYASKRHVIVLLLWHAGCRVGALRALDVDDLDLAGDRPNATGPGIKFVHRPDEGTPLKNKRKSERWNTISEGVANVIEDYIASRRTEAEDDYGRRPLISTRYGRMSRSAIRQELYRVTRPCWYNDGCPHDRDPDECEATDDGSMSKCPSSRSPHDVRSGRLTFYRLREVDEKVVSDRMDASEEILDKHYDRRSERQKAEQRRSHLPDV
ncbi:XerC/D-like integrase [Natronomonas pharaonis DSM 2160]|uniref:XerC/D-like integrase n=1 Tax=Natronomonas pharaonis (strain ATCC 35678 / DSM 2160 / CIP 103997 / JCM 8858 / NBRC 14720 / NCIMB 2260 / Gabara) TaxID=348780 RepID=A0A1U7EZQ1_NATPD|nr:site-specific integrase [Natronomonas pharaonis]CAI50775.1 XerC/D-like integrase [Natronomonas pharaonis DSM 2160]